MGKKATKRTKPLVAKKQTQAKKKKEPVSKNKPSIISSSTAYPYLLKWLCSLFPLACAIEQGIGLINELKNDVWKFLNLQNILKDLLSRNDGNLFVVMGTQMMIKDLKRALMPVIYIIIAPKEVKELPEFVRRKACADSDNTRLFETFSALKFCWKETCDRVFGLHCDRREDTLKNLEEEHKAKYEYSTLADLRNSRAFPVGNNGKLDVGFVSFDCTFPNGSEKKNITFDKTCNVLRHFIREFLDEEDDLEINEENQDTLMAAIKAAFDDKRKTLQRNKEWVHGLVNDVDALENVTCVKVYPSNAEEVLSKLGFANAGNFSTTNTDLDYAINPLEVYPAPQPPVDIFASLDPNEALSRHN